VKRLREGLHEHRTVAGLVDEPLLVAADVGERDVQVARRQHRFGELARRRGIALLLEDFIGAAARALRLLRHHRERQQRHTQHGYDARARERHSHTGVLHRAAEAARYGRPCAGPIITGPARSSCRATSGGRGRGRCVSFFTKDKEIRRRYCSCDPLHCDLFESLRKLLVS
jgi:hypothetical protein